MTATFTETLQVHYLAMPSSQQFAKLVESYKPEYVFITVVERDILAPWFESFPPQ